MLSLSDLSPACRRDHLREALPSTVDLLRQCRAREIGDDYIDGYIELNWLEWNGGSLRLTTTGQNVCRQVTTRAR